MCERAEGNESEGAYHLVKVLLMTDLVKDMSDGVKLIQLLVKSKGSVSDSFRS
jgi:hypothetical protein